MLPDGPTAKADVVVAAKVPTVVVPMSIVVPFTVRVELETVPPTERPPAKVVVPVVVHAFVFPRLSPIVLAVLPL